MSRSRYNQYDDEPSSYWGTPTTFPDILSAPAPVLRDQDIMIDGETVDHLNESSTRSFASPPHQQQYQKHQQQATTPMYAQPSPVQAQYAPAPRQTSPTTVTSPAVSSLTTSPTSASPPHSSQPSPSFVNQHHNHQQGQSFSSSNQQTPRNAYDPYYSGTSNASPHYHQSGGRSTGEIMYQTRDMPNSVATRPPEVARMRQRRKVATAAAGVVGGIAGLAVLGPIGALAGGVGGAMMTKSAGKRMERKQTERIAAQRHAEEERRYGRTVPALQADSGLL